MIDKFIIRRLSNTGKYINKNENYFYVLNTHFNLNTNNEVKCITNLRYIQIFL